MLQLLVFWALCSTTIWAIWFTYAHYVTYQELQRYKKLDQINQEALQYRQLSAGALAGWHLANYKELQRYKNLDHGLSVELTADRIQKLSHKLRWYLWWSLANMLPQSQMKKINSNLGHIFSPPDPVVWLKKKEDVT